MEWLPSVATYINALSSSAETTSRAEDRPRYEAHLASAARLVALLASDSPPGDIAEWIKAEDRAFGWGYLSGEPGEAAERAFARLKDQIGGT